MLFLKKTHIKHKIHKWKKTWKRTHTSPDADSDLLEEVSVSSDEKGKCIKLLDMYVCWALPKTTFSAPA